MNCDNRYDPWALSASNAAQIVKAFEELRKVLAIAECGNEKVRHLAMLHPKERVRKKNTQRAYKEYLRRVKRGG